MSQQPIPISSLNDPRIDLYRNVRDRDLYGRGGVFLAETEMVVKRLLATPHRLRSLLLSPTRYEAMKQLLDALPDDIPIFVAELETMCEIAGFHVHRGVLAIGTRPPTEELSLSFVMHRFNAVEPLTLLLAEGITNVDNMGSLFRTAAGFGVDAVVLDQACCDPLYRKSVRVSMGHVLSVPYAICTNWQDALRSLKDQWGVSILGAETCDHSEPIWKMPHPERSAILVGSEAHGLRAETLQQCDFLGEIPMHGMVPSVNVVMAAAVCLYELQRPNH